MHQSKAQIEHSQSKALNKALNGWQDEDSQPNLQ
jgi:hypothetical protein